MRTAGLICLAIIASACTTTSDTADTTGSPGTTLAASTTTLTEGTASSDSTGPTTIDPDEIAVQVGDDVKGQGTLRARLETVLPHDFKAQTQGLAWDGVGLVESTGPYGSSQRRFLSPTSGRTSQALDLAPEIFATDLTVFDGRGFQLSAREGLATVFSLDDLAVSERLRFDGDGWGICATGQTLVMSSNSAILTLRDPLTLSETSSLELAEELDQLRALECVNGVVWAVLGDTNTVVAIDLESGDLKGTLDLNQLVPGTAGPNDVLTAIAYNPTTDTFFVAGRRWGVVYELSVETPG